MIHAYHIILPMYGFWLPNDPRGSWSDFVRSWELAKFAKATISCDRSQLPELTTAQRQQRTIAKNALKYPAVSLSGTQALSIGNGFARKVASSRYTVWACAILPEHTHLVIARHRYKVEQIANLLKGAATRNLVNDNIHPFQDFPDERGKLPHVWASRLWKVYLDSELAIEEAIHYVEQNPIKEGLPKQHWNFVSPFQGIPKGGWTTYM